MNNNIISDYNEISKRWTVFEDDGISGWLYLTEPNSKKPIADVTGEDIALLINNMPMG